MELVTGRKGVAHITSQQDRMKHQGIFGEGAYILKTGQILEPQVQTSNEIRIRDGALMVQGALSCVKTNSYDTVTIQNGTQGMKRIDLICWQYTYDAEQDVESAEWVVIQGTPAESDPQQPPYTDGDIQQGDSPVQVPVFAVELDGINVTGVTTLLPTAPTLEELNGKLTGSNSWEAYRNNFLGTKSFLFSFGKVHSGEIRSNAIFIPFTNKEVNVSLVSLNIPGLGYIPTDYKEVALGPEGMMYVYCSTPGANGINDIVNNIVACDINISKKI